MSKSELEEQIISTAKSAMHEAIKKELVGYSKPLSKMVTEVIEENKSEIKSIYKSAFQTIIREPNFEDEIIEQFRHKIARVLVSQLEGSVDKAANTLKNDPTIKANMVLTIENIIEEHNSKRNK